MSVSRYRYISGLLTILATSLVSCVKIGGERVYGRDFLYRFEMVGTSVDVAPLLEDCFSEIVAMGIDDARLDDDGTLFLIGTEENQRLRDALVIARLLKERLDTCFVLGNIMEIGQGSVVHYRATVLNRKREHRFYDIRYHGLVPEEGDYRYFCSSGGPTSDEMDKHLDLNRNHVAEVVMPRDSIMDAGVFLSRGGLVRCLGSTNPEVVITIETDNQIRIIRNSTGITKLALGVYAPSGALKRVFHLIVSVEDEVYKLFLPGGNVLIHDVESMVVSDQEEAGVVDVSCDGNFLCSFNRDLMGRISYMVPVTSLDYPNQPLAMLKEVFFTTYGVDDKYFYAVFQSSNDRYFEYNGRCRYGR